MHLNVYMYSMIVEINICIYDILSIQKKKEKIYLNTLHIIFLQ